MQIGYLKRWTCFSRTEGVLQLYFLTPHYIGFSFNNKNRYFFFFFQILIRRFLKHGPTLTKKEVLISDAKNRLSQATFSMLSRKTLRQQATVKHSNFRFMCQMHWNNLENLIIFYPEAYRKYISGTKVRYKSDPFDSYQLSIWVIHNFLWQAKAYSCPNLDNEQDTNLVELQ